jgi:hypothetical protein
MTSKWSKIRYLERIHAKKKKQNIKFDLILDFIYEHETDVNEPL